MTDVVRLPQSTGPGVRKKIPAPFARPSITIGGPIGPRREWQLIPVHQVQRGDIVPGIGCVTSVHEKVLMPEAGSGLAPEQVADWVSWTVTLTGGEGNVRIYGGTDRVYAFAVPSPERVSPARGHNP